MKKRLTFVLTIISLLIEINFQSTAQTVENSDLIELDKSEIILPCPPGYPPICPDDRIIKVKIMTPNPDLKPEDYKYAVSGGQITGMGKEIDWDLKGARPGTYAITISFQNKGKLVSQTKKITLKDCPCMVDCDCPMGIRILSSAETVKLNETITFIAEVKGGSQANPTYIWKVRGGEIVKGQGTSVIEVKASNKDAKTIEAAVEAGGFCPECANKEASITVGIIQPKKEN